MQAEILYILVSYVMIIKGINQNPEKTGKRRIYSFLNLAQFDTFERGKFRIYLNWREWK